MGIKGKKLHEPSFQVRYHTCLSDVPLDDKTAKESLEYKFVDGKRKCSEVYLDSAKLYCSESLLHHMFVLTKWWNNNSWALSCAMSTQLRKIKHKKRANVYIISPLFYFRNKKSMLLYYMVVLLRIFLLLWRGKYIERNIAMVRAKRVVICCSRNKNKVDSPWRPIPAILNLVFMCPGSTPHAGGLYTPRSEEPISDPKS